MAQQSEVAAAGKDSSRPWGGSTWTGVAAYTEHIAHTVNQGVQQK